MPTLGSPRTLAQTLGAPLAGLALALIAGAGCDVGIAPGIGLTERKYDLSVTPIDTDLGGGKPTGLPCDVAQLIETRCLSCHGSPPANGASMTLLSLADLKKVSYADPAADFAHRSLVRIQAGTMPPGGGLTAPEIQVLSAWVNAGEPAGDCTPPDMASSVVHDMTVGPEPDIGAAGTGLPCDLADVIKNRCQSCHGHPPAGGATVELLTRDQLMAKSYANATQDFAQRAVVRMLANQMPPGGGASLSDVAAFQSWINAGEPAGNCAPPDLGGLIVPPDLAVPPNDGPPPPSGLPCDVAAVYQTRCLSCHGQPVQNGAPQSLVTRDQLMTKSLANPAQDYAQRSIVRMMAGQMPPGGGATQMDINTIQAWLNGGEVAGACAPPDMGAQDLGPPPDMARPQVDGGPAGSGLPCDIAQLLQTCASCHGNPPKNGAPMTLLTYSDLIQPSINDPKVDFAHRSLSRMQANTMPPGGGAAQADITALSNWINGGEMQGMCGDGGVIMDPLNAMVACTSGTSWSRGENAAMRPGEACINCHAKSNEAPKFDIGGTLYPTGHEKDDCNADAPSIAGATIVITDNNGAAVTLTPDNVGNFSYTSGGRNGNPVIALPYTAKVVQNGKTRAMGAAQMSGDCNDCHTQTGRNGAPGRVTIPIP